MFWWSTTSLVFKSENPSPFVLFSCKPLFIRVGPTDLRTYRTYLVSKIKAKLLCRLCHQALHPPFYGIAAMLTAATSADKRCKPNYTGPTVSFFKIKPCDKNIWKIINHHNHHGTIRTSLSISCVINCTNPLIGDSETIYQI